jgi:hypothetical protein
VSEDVLPDDLPSYEDYNLKPYDPDAEEEGEEEEETDDEAGEKPEGETSDDDSSSSSSDDESPKENASSSELAKSAVSVHLNKSTAGSHLFIEDNNSEAHGVQSNSNPNPQTNDRPKSTESGKKGWWKPLFGRKKDPKEAEGPVQNNGMQQGEEGKESESSESEDEADAPPKRCFTPHGGSASEYDDGSDDDESDSD